MAVKGIDTYTSADGFGLPLNIRRGNPNPLDNSEIWANISEAMEYAKNNPTAYVGQVISYFYTDGQGNELIQLAQITNEDGELTPIKGGEGIVLQEMTENEIDAIMFSVFGV